MRRWFARVVPGSERVGVFLLIYVALEAVYWLDFLIFGPPRPQAGAPVRDFIVMLAALAYGVSRITRFHPLYDTAYREWLETTPWTAARPLPVGPVHLVVQDVVVVLGLIVLTLPRIVSDPSRVPLAFLGGYLAALALSLWPTGAKAYSYVLAFGLGLVVRLWPYPSAALIVAAVLYVPGYAGLRQSLRRFPWEVPAFFRLSWWKSLQNPSGDHDPHLPRQEILGWPYDRLGPRLNSPSIRMADGALISLLGGWWVFVIAALWIQLAGGAPQRLALLGWLLPFSFVPLAIGAGLRATLYGWAYKPPISFWGRIRTFRWIIPGYDRAVMAPGAALIVPQASLLVAALALPRGLVSPAILCALPITVGLFILLNGQPSLASWQLTGQHRIAPGYTKNKTFPALTGDYFDEVVEI